MSPLLKRKIKIPNRKNIKKTHSNDPLDFYYYPLANWVFVKRLRMALLHLGEKRYERILEIGYGSGIFLPELASRCNHLFGIDRHGSFSLVKNMMKKEEIKGEILGGDIFNIPFQNDTFDCVVCISVLEHLKNLEQPLAEANRVLKKKGLLIAGFPVKHKITDGWFFLTGTDYNLHHPSNHRQILKAIEKKFKIKELFKFPFFTPLDYSLYVACAGLKK